MDGRLEGVPSPNKYFFFPRDQVEALNKAWAQIYPANIHIPFKMERPLHRAVAQKPGNCVPNYILQWSVLVEHLGCFFERILNMLKLPLNIFRGPLKIFRGSLALP